MTHFSFRVANIGREADLLKVVFRNIQYDDCVYHWKDFDKFVEDHPKDAGELIDDIMGGFPDMTTSNYIPEFHLDVCLDDNGNVVPAGMKGKNVFIGAANDDGYHVYLYFEDTADFSTIRDMVDWGLSLRQEGRITTDPTQLEL